MPMRLITTIGNLRKQMADNVRMAEVAVQGGVAEATVSLKERLRLQTTTAGLGRRLGNTWRSNVHPKRPSMTANGLVWTKAPHIMTPHAFGATIRATGGRRFLSIAMPAAGKGRGGGRLLPRAWEARTGRKLRFVPERGGDPARLVTDHATGGFSKSGSARISRSARPRSAKTETLFILLPQVRLRKRLDVERAAAAAVASIPKSIGRRWKE